MLARLALAALATGTARAASYSYNYTEAPTAAPTSSMAPTRTETYAPTRMTEAPSYAPTTDTYAPTMAPTATAGPTPVPPLCADPPMPGQYECLMQNLVVPTEQCTAFEDWRANLTGTETSITMYANGATVACTDPFEVVNIVSTIRTWTYLPFFGDHTYSTAFCDGITWSFGACGGVMEIHAGGDNTICPVCPDTTGPSEIRMRPCMTITTSWGGGNGPTCDAPTQTFAISTTEPITLCADLGPGQYECEMQFGLVPVEQCTAFNTWRGSLTGTETSITMSANGATVKCADPAKAVAITTFMKLWVPGLSQVFSCDGITWSMGGCGGAQDVLEIHAGGDDTICAPGCPGTGPSEIRMRPCVPTPDWGGGNGDVCYAPTQTFVISTTTSRRLTERVHGPVTRAFHAWTQRQFATP